MLSDDRLQQLLRDAHALEAFERGEPAAARPRPRTRRWAYYAAAAIGVYVCLHLTLTAILVPRPSPKPTPQPNVVRANPAPKSSLLLAVYQNEAGKLSCVNWSADALKGRTMASLSTEELTRLGLTLSCDPSAARILVVGLEGPAAALPTSDARAQAVAQCLSTTPPCASGTFNPKTCASAGCLDNNVTVRIESLALK